MVGGFVAVSLARPRFPHLTAGSLGAQRRRLTPSFDSPPPVQAAIKPSAASRTAAHGMPRSRETSIQPLITCGLIQPQAGPAVSGDCESPILMKDRARDAVRFVDVDISPERPNHVDEPDGRVPDRRDRGTARMRAWRFP